MDFNKARTNAINNVAYATQKASEREARSVDNNTRAIQDFQQAVTKLPIEIGDNMPKYSEREMRELREEVYRLQRAAGIAREIERDLQMILRPTLDHLGYELMLYLPNTNTIKIDDVSFREDRIVIKLDQLSCMEMNEARQARRLGF